MAATLLLSSFGFNSPILREKFAQAIPREVLRDKTCLVVPYAGFDAEKTFEREKQGLIEFGFSPEHIRCARNGQMVVTCCPDYLYVPGGDPFKLLRTIRETGMLDAIKECVNHRGTIYIGVSAGADVAAGNIRYVTELEDNNEIHDQQFEALALINESVLCHYDHYTYATLKACQEVSGRPVVTINDDQVVQFYDGIWNYVGENG